VTGGLICARRWPWACAFAAVLAGLAVSGAQQGQRSRPPEPAPGVVRAAAAPTGGTAPSRYSGRTGVFGLAQPGERPGEVLFAPARRHRPGGPETLRAVAVEPEETLRLAPGAVIRLTMPLAGREPADSVRGIPVTPERFPVLFRAAQERLGALHDRARMFELSFDDRGRIVRMNHHFSP
jgi:hypothetical protein